MEPKEQGKQHHQISIQKGSISSSITNQAKKQGITDHRGDFLSVINQPSATKTPSTNMFINGLVLSTTKVHKIGQNIRGKTSCQQKLDSSINYPNANGFPFGEAKITKKEGTQLSVYSNIKVNRQTNTSLGLGPNSAAGLIIGNNTVKILKPNLSQQKLGNSLQKACSFDKQFGPRSQTSGKGSSVPKASVIKIKGQDITRVDYSIKNTINPTSLLIRKKTPNQPNTVALVQSSINSLAQQTVEELTQT